MNFEEQRRRDYLKASDKKAAEKVSLAEVSPFDLDFLVVLHIAIGFDIVFFFLAIFDASIITWVIGMILSPIPLAIVGIWDYKRTGKLERAKGEAQRIKKTAQEMAKKMKEAAVKAEKKAVQKAATKTATKTAAKAGTRVLGRGAIAIFGTNIPFIGLWPFYTVWVLKTLKSK
jgi:hypothetical protein